MTHPVESLARSIAEDVRRFCVIVVAALAVGSMTACSTPTTRLVNADPPEASGWQRLSGDEQNGYGVYTTCSYGARLWMVTTAGQYGGPAITSQPDASCPKDKP